VTSVPFWSAVNVTADPAPPLPVILMEVPWSQVTVIAPVDAPMLTVAVPLIAPDFEVFVAVMVAVLVTEVTAVTRPELFTFATVVSELVQAELPVRFWVLPSLNVPVATNCTVWPTVCNEGAEGTIAMLVRVGSTKKPWQPIATAHKRSTANPDTS
jgi:hypothetical protein